MPSCHNTVGEHKPGKNKQVCNMHRTTRKHEVDEWKLSQGCANKTGKYGFKCVCSEIIDPATLDINHIDGNNFNRDPANVEVLCKMCHTTATILQEHHLTTGGDRRVHIEDPNRLFAGLLD